MMNYEIIRKIVPLVIFAIVVSMFLSCDDTWSEHYDEDNSIVADKNLWETISSNSDLSAFASLLKDNGYDNVLSASQMYTVWAPSNNALADFNMADTIVVKEFLNNHIARFSTTASGDILKNITMLNSKVTTFKKSSGYYLIEDIELADQNILARNGIVHVIDQRIPFFSNIWEYLPKISDLDSLSNYLYSFNRVVFDPKQSVEGGTDERGNTVYLDSVFINSNEKFGALGMLNDEDSSYTILCPTNQAWSNAYLQVEDYFNYYSMDTAVADTLRRYYTLQALTNNLVFSESMQGEVNDSIITTQNNVLTNPDTIRLNSTVFTASNGSLVVVDSLRIKPWEAWHQELVVEAETLKGRESTFASINNRTSYSSVVKGISNNTYVEISPTNTGSNPTVTFNIPNTLSASYRVYCVFVPATASNSDAKNLKPNKVSFQLIYQNSYGQIKTQRFVGNEYVTQPDTLYKMLVTDNFKFPTANYDQEEVNVKLKVLSNVRQNETTTYTRTMLIDCIILEPVH